MSELETAIREALSTDRHRATRTGPFDDIVCSCRGWSGPDNGDTADSWRRHLIDAVVRDVCKRRLDA